MKTIITGVAALLWVGATGFAGGWTQDELTRQIDQVEAVTHAMVRAEIVSYEKGFWKSEAVTRWTLGSSGGSTGGDPLELVHHISHGPNPLFGWARITTEPVLSPEAKTALWPYFWNSPITVVTTVGFTGTRKLNITSPETSTEKGPARTPRIASLSDILNLPKTISNRTKMSRVQEMRTRRQQAPGHIVWKGLSGKGEFTKEDGWIEINMPGFEASGGGTGNMNLASLYFKGKKSRVEGEAFWTRDTEMGFGEISLDVPGMVSFHVGKTVLASGDKMEPDGTVSHYVQKTVNGLKAESAGEQIHIKRAHMALNLSNLDRQAVEELSVAFGAQMDARMKAIGNHQVIETNGMPAATRSTKAFISVLQGSPVFTIEAFKIESDLGDLEASARAAFDGNGFVVRQADSSPESQADALRRVNFTFDASISEALLEGLFTWGNLEAAIKRQKGPAGASALAKRMAREEIASLVVGGLLSPDGDRYELSMSIKNNILLLNGRPADGAMGQFIGQLMNGA